MTSSENIAVVGALGMLGQELGRQFSSLGKKVSALDLNEIDITSVDSVNSCLPLAQAEIIFNCAAYTNVEKSEEEAAQALAVNGTGVRHLAELARRSGALLVHLSTDFVFDGRRTTPYPVNAPRHPLSSYGRSKLAGEYALEEVGARTLLVRTAWLYGSGGKNFVDTMISQASRLGRLEVVNDQVGSPTYAKDLAAALIELALGGHEGVFHCTNDGPVSWYEFASEIMRLSGINAPVTPLSTSEANRRFQLKAARPAYSVLEGSRLTAALGRKMRPWKDALADYLSTAYPR